VPGLLCNAARKRNLRLRVGNPADLIRTEIDSRSQRCRRKRPDRQDKPKSSFPKLSCVGYLSLIGD
jgi:hypothetical protein